MEDGRWMDEKIKPVDQHSLCPGGHCPPVQPQLNQPFLMFKCWVGGVNNHKMFLCMLLKFCLEKLL